MWWFLKLTHTVSWDAERWHILSLFALDTVLSVLNMFSIILINYANMQIFLCYTNSVKKKMGNFRSTRFCSLRRFFSLNWLSAFVCLFFFPLNLKKKCSQVKWIVQSLFCMIRINMAFMDSTIFQWQWRFGLHPNSTISNFFHLISDFFSY